MIWFTADTHFGHAGILKHQPERAALYGCDVNAMDTAIIDGINKYVKSNDELWILGDFCWQASRAGHYRQRLRCRKIHIVAGNHDASSLKRHVSSIAPMVYKKFGQQKFHLSHYPYASWRAREHGSIHLYGHCHGSMEEILNRVWPGRRAIDVGMDHAYRLFTEWRPFSLAEIIERFPLLDLED